METQRVDQLSSSGMIGDDKLVCQYVMKQAYGSVWLGDNPLQNPTSILFLQIILMFVAGRITYFLLRPCHQTFLVAQIVVSFSLIPSQLTTIIVWFINLSCQYPLVTRGI